VVSFTTYPLEGRYRSIDMDSSMAGFATYELMHVETGVPLYQTYATEYEILEANANLRNRGVLHRFVLAGTFYMPSLHSTLTTPS